jgi:hypothetical protein
MICQKCNQGKTLSAKICYDEKIGFNTEGVGKFVEQKEIVCPCCGGQWEFCKNCSPQQKVGNVLLQEGVTAYKAGKRDEARKIFIALVKQEPDNERAWGWLYQVSNNDRERNHCLQQILSINPENEKVKQMLHQIGNRQPKSDKPAPAIWNIIRVSGILLILWSLISLVGVYDQINLTASADLGFPCAVSFEMRFKDTPMPFDTRIVYCIQSRHYKIDGPGKYYAQGTTHLNQVMAGELKLRRQEQTLFVNDQPLQIGERYDVVRQNPSNNPWLRFTTHFVIDNSGLYSGSNALNVTGDVKEGWQFSPLGAIILDSGIGLAILGNWGTKRKKIARGQYVMEPSVPRNIKARDIAVGFFGWMLFNSVCILSFYMSLDLVDNLFVIWLPTIIATLVLYGMKRFSICTGIVLAVVINSGIWMVISPVMNVSFFDALLLCGIPLPFGLLILFGW